MKNKRTPKQNRVMCQCRKCSKPYSYDNRKGEKYGGLCRECATKK